MNRHTENDNKNVYPLTALAQLLDAELVLSNRSSITDGADVEVTGIAPLSSAESSQCAHALMHASLKAVNNGTAPGLPFVSVPRRETL